MEFFSYLLPETEQSLASLDLALNIIHTALILFVLFGVFFKNLIKWHFPVLIIIWISWMGIGLYVGHVGYCLLTDWHWQVKAREGQINLPNSYIEYLYRYIFEQEANASLIKNITAGVMIAVTLVSGYRFFKFKRV